MSVFSDICLGLSAGIVSGFAAGGLKAHFRHSSYSSWRMEVVRPLWAKKRLDIPIGHFFQFFPPLLDLHDLIPVSIFFSIVFIQAF